LVSVGGLRLSLEGRAQSEDKGAAQGDAAPKAQAPGGVDPGADAAQLAQANVAMRSLLQRMGAGLGAAATAILAGLGWTRLNDIFPIPRNVESWTWALLIVAVVSALIGSAWLSSIFFVAQRRIMIGTTKRSRRGLHGDDKSIADRVLKEHARFEEAPKILDIELRALRFERIARSLKPAEAGTAKALHAESDRLYGFVGLALHRAASAVLENRSRRAFFQWPTFVALAAGGIFGSFAIADYYKGERDLSALQVTCAKGEESFPNACAPFETSAARVRRQREQKATKAASSVVKARAVKASKRTPAQKRLLAAVATCQKAIPRSVTGPTRAKAVGLCAVAAAK